MDMTGKVALVTGAQQGIGAAVALALGMAGAKVVVNYLDDKAGAEKICAEIRARGGVAEIIAGSVARSEDVAAMNAACNDLGGADILVNNAGIFPRVPFLEMSEEDWDTVIDVNLKGSFRCARAVVPEMVDRGRGGAIINLTSSAAFRSSPRGVHYVASKAGLIGLTRALALELAPHLIRVNAIAPGLTDTAQPRFGMNEEEIAQLGNEVPLGRIGYGSDIADMAVFLASDAASHVTGQTMHVNGGQYLY